MIDIVIIDQDTLRSLGLKYLIERFFDIRTTISKNITNIDLNKISPTTLFFTTPECYVASQDFFIPRRSRTILLSNDNGLDMVTLNTQQDESTIIYELNNLISKDNTNNVEQKNNKLSQREIDVLRLVAMGFINKEIADRLSISFNTVLTHRKNITAKLGIRSASGLGFYAMMNGYISENDIKR